jgi:hypothetical protein
MNHNADRVVRYLLKQLIFQLDEMPDPIDDAYDLYETDRQEPEREFFCNQLKNAIQSFNTVFLFLDSLDQLPRHDRGVLCELFQQFPKTRVKIFMTLTSELKKDIDLSDKPMVRNLLQGARKPQIISKAEDIKLYVKHQVKKKAKGYSPRTKQRIVEKISSQGLEQYYLFMSVLTKEFFWQSSN